MENLKHVMVDLETFGTGPDSVIVKIAAVNFDLASGRIGESIEIDISVHSAIEHGLKMDPSTVLWWLTQDEKPRLALYNAAGTGFSLPQALVDFSTFMEKCGNDCEIWGNSARFDLGLLQDAYNKINIRIPWDFRKERCVRTLLSFAPGIKKAIPFEGTPHCPVDDCKHQIAYCHAIWKTLNSHA